MKLKGKVAIITGGSRGIGRVVAEGFAEEGASIVIADISKADIAAKEMNQKGYNTISIPVDVASERDTMEMAAKAFNAFGRIDILFNNAAILSSLIPGEFDKIRIEEWRQVMDVNVMGIWLCCKAVVGKMCEIGGGRIINMASMAPLKGVPGFLHYVTSKGAVIALTRAMARELGKSNILVNAIAPGFTLSEGIISNDLQVKLFRQVSVQGRSIMKDQFPLDIVGAAKFFAGPDSSFITGQTLVVDGGGYFH